MQNLSFKVQRYDPDKDSSTHMQEFTVPFTKGMSVLDGLLYIKEHLDNTLAFRSSCRMGICGSCGMLINKIPRLACHTPVEELETDKIEVKSLPNYPIIKDLVPQLELLFEKHKSVKPYMIREDSENIERPDTGLYQSVEELDSFMQFSYCIKCGLCMSACPTVATDSLFLGPQPLAQGYRYCADTRDDADQERFNIVDSPHGIWLCHMAGACSEACPKGLDPAFAIQLFKRMMAAESLGIRKQPKSAPAVQPPRESKPKIEVPEITVK
ncbi:MAG: succinate dehydrogenase iron-sulfur subunit [Dehalococcoidia bacterium]